MTATKVPTPIAVPTEPPPARVDPAMDAATKRSSIDSAIAMRRAAAPPADHEPGPEGEPAPHRALLFFGYGVAGEVTRRLRAARSKASALRKHPPVHVRCDVTDLL